VRWDREWARGLVVGALVCVGCGSPTAPDLEIAPIVVESVEVQVLESFPPQASARVRGYIGDGCSTIHSVEQTRSGNTVTLTILRQRPADAICIQIALVYDQTIRLQGSFPPGRYVLRVNGLETEFTTQ